MFNIFNATLYSEVAVLYRVIVLNDQHQETANKRKEEFNCSLQKWKATLDKLANNFHQMAE